MTRRDPRPRRLRLPAPRPKCTGIATTVHHLLPSCQYPHLFFDASNLAAACRHCNYSGGREIQLANRTDRQLLNHYEEIIERQRAELDELNRRLAAYECGDAEPRRVPRIY